MKLPTMSVGMPYGSLRMVNEKQQSTMLCSFAVGSVCAGVAEPEFGRTGRKRSWQDVSTAF